jgi:hypothetical protein
MRTSFDFTLTAKQFLLATRHNNQRWIRALPVRWLLQLSTATLVGAPAFLLAYSFDLLNSPYAMAIQPAWIAAWVMLAAIVTYGVLYQRGLNRWLSRSSRYVGNRTTVHIEENGLRCVSSYGEGFTPWCAMQGVEETGDVILLLLDSIHYILISASAFASEQERDEFIGHVRNRIQSAAGPAQSNTPAADAAPSSAMELVPPPASAPTFKANARLFLVGVGQAFKLLFFFAVPAERIRVTWWQVPAFALASLVLSFLWALFEVGLAGEFMWYSLPMAVFHLPVLLLGAIFISYALRRSDQSLLLVQVFLMIGLAFDLTWAFLTNILALRPGDFAGLLPDGPFFSLPSLWLALACFVAGKRYATPSVPRRAWGMAIALMVIALPLGLVYRQLTLW